MANWTLLRALGWAPKSRFFAAEAQAIDEFLTKVPNCADGSTHNPSAVVTIGGAGLTVTGPFTATSAQITIPTGKTLSVTGTGAISVANTASLSCSGTATFSGATGLSGAVSLTNTMTCSGSGKIVCTGSTGWDLRTGCTSYVKGGAVVEVAGTGIFDLASIDIGAFGGLNVSSGGGIFIQSGGGITSVSGAAVNLSMGEGGTSGALNVGADGKITLKSGSTLTHKGSSSEVYESTAAVTFQSGSTIDNTATETRRGPTTLNGIDAWTGLRAPTTPAEGAASIDPWKYNVVRIPTLTANRSWNLNAPPGNARVGTFFKRIYDGSASDGYTMSLGDTGTSDAVASWPTWPGGGYLPQGTVFAWFNGTKWEPLFWCGYIGDNAGQPL